MGVPIVLPAQAPLRTEQKRTESIPFVINTPKVYNIPFALGSYLERIDVGFDGDIVISGGTVNGTATGRENPEAIVQRVRVTAGRKGRILNLPVRALILWNIMDRGRVSAQGTDLTGAAGTFTQAGHFPIPFALPSLRRPFDTALHTGRFGAPFQLIFECADQTQILTGNDRTWNFDALRFNIEELRTIGQPPADLNMDTGLLVQGEVIKEVTAAVDNFTMDFEPGLIYKEILFTAEVDNALADSVIDKITIETAGQQFFQATENDIKRKTRARVTDAAQSITGLYLVDLAPDGLISQAVDARGVSKLQATLEVLNPSGTNFVKAYYRAIIPAAQI